MPEADPNRIRSFETPAEFNDWLAQHHGEPELWLRIYRKKSGIQTIIWEEAVVEALCWGWIDGIKKSYDEVSFIQRFSPRKKGSHWSMVNRRSVERLIQEGRMQPPGLARVDEAKANGRWDKAYLGPAEAETPADFLKALEHDLVAKETYEKLNSGARFAIYYRLHSALTEKTRERRKAVLLDKLRAGITEL